MHTLLLLLVMVIFCSPTSWATNGMNMIGYGAVSSAMGGADLALVDNVTAMNINPAGLCGCSGTEISVGDSMMQPRNHHEDHHGNDLLAEEQLMHLPLIAWSHPVKDTPFSIGLGLFAQGGMGLRYENFHLPFADLVDIPQEYDEISSSISYVKITPTLAWHSKDCRLKLGICLQGGYATAEMNMFPNTSISVDSDGNNNFSFMGMKLKDSRALTTGLRLGFQYRWGDLTLGGAYLTASKLTYKNGNAQINYSALGEGRVDYAAEMSGFNWPRQAGLGCSYNVSDKLKLAVDVDWINWSKAVKKIQISLHQTNNDSVPHSLTYNYPMAWRDQFVFAAGMEYRCDNDLCLRLGYNHGNNPVPAKNLFPYFPAIVTDHVTAGTGLTWGEWQIDLALEWALKKKGSGANGLFCQHGYSAEVSQFISHIMVTHHY
ncbi:MAG: outer membrane protein transport protein [Desulfuromonas sp.]|nr:outer membrane protein transport protein [Desulfuromonas sp.]